jgi:hypothetical protein
LAFTDSAHPKRGLVRVKGGGDCEAIVGDLDERYRQGRSYLWYWRQAFTAILASVWSEVRTHKALTIRAVMVGWVTLIASILLLFIAVTGVNALISAAIGSAIMSGSTGLGDLNRHFHIQKRFFQFRMPWSLSLVIFVAMLCVGYALAGSIVARLHRAHARAMVLLFAASQTIPMMLPFRRNNSIVMGVIGLVSTLC